MYRKVIQDINEIRERIGDAGLSPIFSWLRSVISSEILAKHSYELDSIENVYKQLLQYFVAGATDPERSRMINELSVRLYLLAERLFVSEGFKRNEGYYFTLKAKEDEWQEDIPTLINAYRKAKEDRVHQEVILGSLFSKILLADDLEKEDISALLEVEETEAQTIVIAAITLGLYFIFSSEKVAYLFKIMIKYPTDREIYARALVGLVLLFREQRFMIEQTKDSYQALWGLLEDAHPGLYDDIRLIITQLYVERHTDIISSKLRTAIRDGVSDIKTDDLRKIAETIDLDDPEKHIFEISKDPLLEDKVSRMERLRKEIQEMKERGEDVSYITFRDNNNYTEYFRTLSNWFLPFNERSSLLLNLSEGDPMIIAQVKKLSVQFCSTDTYALMGYLETMPMEIRRQMLFAMSSGDESLLAREDISAIPKLERNHIRFYLADLYRFFRASSFLGSFYDPFIEPYRLDGSYPFIGKLLTEKALEFNVLGILKRQGDVEETLSFVSFLLERYPNEAELWIDWGFLLEQKEQYREAIVKYRKAVLLSGETPWLVKRQIVNYIKLKDYVAALNLIRNAGYVRTAPCDPYLQTCLIGLGLWKEAFLNVTLQEELNGEMLGYRMLSQSGLIALVMQDFERAERFLLQIDQEKLSLNDLLNLGHTYVGLKKYKEAMETYKRAVEKSPRIPIRYLVDDDRHYWEMAGISQAEISLVIDALMML